MRDQMQSGFTDEADARGVDTLFDAMSPGEGGGRRQSADIYEVAIDQAFST